MCDCNKHLKRRAKCTCVCPEHANFQAAYDLAMQRFDVILDLERQLEQALTAQPTISAEQLNLAAGYLSTTIAQYQHVMNVRGALRRALAEAGLTVAGESDG